MATHSYPQSRLRRMRSSSFSRLLQRENHLLSSDLIYPVFVIEDGTFDKEIAAMPGVLRKNLTDLMHTCEECVQFGIPAVALFPVVEAQKKTADACEAFNDKGLIPTAIKEIKKRFPSLGIISDIALDPYTSHGQDGVIDSEGYVLNDETIDILVRQALSHAAAGADIVAPSDMMDGRIGAVRRILEENKFYNTKILSYAAKYASNFYGPFREAVGSKESLGSADKNAYQMDPANSNEALLEAKMDISEGADMIMVKPGLPYLDIVRILKDTYKVPTFAYQVSGEYSMIKAASMNGWISEKECVLESLLSFKRAGCDGVLSYYALDAAKWLEKL